MSAANPGGRDVKRNGTRSGGALGTDLTMAVRPELLLGLACGGAEGRRRWKCSAESNWGAVISQPPANTGAITVIACRARVRTGAAVKLPGGRVP